MRRFCFLLVLSAFIQVEPVFAGANFKDFYKQLKFLSQRDRMISKNIANADTPRYLPQDIRNLKASESSGIMLSRTHPSHFDVDDEGIEFEVFNSPVSELKPSGNGVTLEDEMLKKSENAMRLQETVNLYNKAKSILRTSIVGVGGNK